MPLPDTRHPELSATNFDFTARALFGPVQDGAMVQQGNYLYIGMESALVVLYIGDPSRPMMVGWLELGSLCKGISNPGNGVSIFVANYKGGLHTIDITNPSAPSIYSSYIPASPNATLNGVSASGGKAYVAAGADGLLVVDLLTQTLTTSYNTPGTANAVDVLGNYAYVADGSAVRILDISVVPPVLKGSVATNNSVAVKAVTVGASTRLYVADDMPAADLRILDVTTPTAPTQLSVLNTSGTGGLDVGGGSGTYAYLATSAGLVVIDVTNPAAPVETKLYATTGKANAIHLSGTMVQVGTQGGGVQIVETSPSIPTLVGEFRNAADTISDVAVSGGKLFFMSQPLGLAIMDMSTPQRPTLIGSYAVAPARSLDISGTTAFVGTTGAIRLVDVSVPSSPSFVKDITAVGVVEFRVAGGYAYAATTSSAEGLKVLRLSDGFKVGALDTGDGAAGIEVSDGVAYMTDGSELVTVNVSNPAAPVALGRALAVGTGGRVSVSGHFALVATSVGLEVFDVATPSLPYWVSMYPMLGGASGALATNGLVYLAADPTALSVLDVSRPWAPVQVGSLDIPGVVGEHIAYSGGYAILATKTGGALVTHYTPQCMDAREPNDAFASASAITTGSYYDQFICNSGDQDYFALTLPSGGTLTAVMEPPTTMNYDMYLYDSSGALLQASPAGLGQQETISRTVTSAGTYYLLVNGANGNQYSATVSYRLTPTFAACAGPTLPLLIYNARRDANNYVILDILDPNQPSTRTGYNIYRATAPTGPWSLIAGNVVDMDGGTANTQYVDQESNGGPTFYYNVRAVNGTCGSEGP